MSSTASPATNPAVRAEPGGHERGDHRPLSRPGRGPRRARPVHDEGRSRLAQLHQDPQGRRARWRPSPGSSRPVTVAHCGPVLKGEFARTVNMTAVLTGWTFTRSIRNNAEKHIISAPGAAVDAIPPPRAGHGLRQRVGIHQPRRGAVGREPGHLLPPARAPTGRTTRPPSRPEKQPRGAPLRLPATATDADAERQVPGRLWELVDIRVNFLTPTRKPIGWGAGRTGRRKHLRAGPAHPQAGCWTPTP